VNRTIVVKENKVLTAITEGGIISDVKVSFSPVPKHWKSVLPAMFGLV